MNLQHRIDLLVRLGDYILSNSEDWEEAKIKASQENGWFIPAFIDYAVQNISKRFLQKELLENWVSQYQLPEINPMPKKVGIVMAGNIPLVGFHDFLCVFIAGHQSMIKTSSKDDTLPRHLVAKLASWDEEVNDLVEFAPMLKGCDAYIATGSNNSAGYFEYYFGKYPHIIRRNRSSAAILTGGESQEELEWLADDIYLFFGLGCRNVTKLFVPEGYDFVPLLNAFKKYEGLADHHKYKNNYDYNLAIHLLNKKYFMSTPSLLLVEETALFSPVSQLNYEYYKDRDKLTGNLKQHPDLQCLVGRDKIPFGQSQSPSLTDYADGVDTLAFVSRL